MNCFRSFSSKNHSSPQTTSLKTAFSSKPDDPKTEFRSEQGNPPPQATEQVIVQIPGAIVHIIEEGETLELTRGELTIVLLAQGAAGIATIMKIGDVQWLLPKDVPVVKTDNLHYLFSVPDSDGDFLSCGVSFTEPDARLASLDSFLEEHSCFSVPPSTETSRSPSSESSRRTSLEASRNYWKDFAPRIEDYNGILAKAIAGGTGEIVKGIFKLSNGYCEQVQKGGELVRTRDVKVNSQSFNGDKSRGSGVKKSVKRVRKLSKMTEKMSQALLDGVFLATGTVGGPIIRSAAGKKFMSMMPGEVLLASLDAVNKVLDTVEVAEKDAFAATTNVIRGIVSQRFGENAGEVTEDVFATAGHAIGTAWNVFKFRKAINPKSTLSSVIVKNAGKKRSAL